MTEFIEAHKLLVTILAGSSVIMFIGTLILIPILIIRMPVNYFTNEDRATWPWKRCHPVICIIFMTLKNLLGAIFVIFGVIMLITPGQGLLSIIIGLTMMNYPGKYHLERWLVSHDHVRHALDWIRHKAHKPSLEHIL